MTRELGSLARLLDAFRASEVFITAAAFAVLILVIFADVVVRRVTGSGIIWAREVGVFANSVLCVLGIGIASASGAHLRPRFVDGWLPHGWSDGITRVQEALTAVAFAILAWLSIVVLRDTIALGDRSEVLRILVWPIQLCLPLAFGLAVLRHGIYAWRLDLRPSERGEADVQASETLPNGPRP